MAQLSVSFPPGFIWGAATSSYQIEGARNEDGKGESIWDRFCAMPGHIEDGSSGADACDHYHRWREDVQMMRDLGLGAYRFSISWPRILPNGHGKINPVGLDYYSRLVDALLDAGIRPFATLYHWDLPQTLQDRGGWPARDTAKAFVEYAEVVVRRLGDRVKDWTTFNEPWVIAFMGHLTGEHAPGHRNAKEAVRASHHVLLAHGWALPVIRRDSPGSAAGIVVNLSPHVPSPVNEANLRRAALADEKLNRWFIDPLAGRRYPEDAVASYHVPLDFIESSDMQTIAGPIDFLGVNYYTRTLVKARGRGRAEPRLPVTEMGWEIYPQGLYDTLTRLRREYPFTAYYITENGAALPDVLGPDGAVDDADRVAYLREHLAAAASAIADGVPLRGYFAWSLMDNFEWSHGYTKRFGICYVNFGTQERIPKRSARWYAGVIAANGLPLE